MEREIEIKVLAGEYKKEYAPQLLKLYDPENKREMEYNKSFLYSTFIIVGLLDNKIIASVRIISDMFMCAMILDLLVDPLYRKQGIGSKVIRKSVEVCISEKIKNIELIADSANSSLVDFYEKLGFENNIENGIYMSFNKNKIIDLI